MYIQIAVYDDPKGESCYMIPLGEQDVHICLQCGDLIQVTIQDDVCTAKIVDMYEVYEAKGIPMLDTAFPNLIVYDALLVDTTMPYGC